MAEIAGIDTISSSFANDDKVVTLPYSSMLLANVSQATWIDTGLGVLPVCVKCKTHVSWYSPPDESGILFRCPTCGKLWKKDDQWEQDKKANLQVLMKSR